jgi:hypothetical protein
VLAEALSPVEIVFGQTAQTLVSTENYVLFLSVLPGGTTASFPVPSVTSGTAVARAVGGGEEGNTETSDRDKPPGAVSLEGSLHGILPAGLPGIPSILQAGSNRFAQFETGRAGDPQGRPRRLRTEDVDLALFLPLVENKVLGMAESIQDGDDPVQQFAQFLPKQESTRKTIQPPAPVAAKESASEQQETLVAKQATAVWPRTLLVPGVALVVGVVGFVVGRYRFRRR